MLKEDAYVSCSGRDDGKTSIDLKCFRREIELTAEPNEVLLPQSLERLQRPIIVHQCCQLTVKLRGRVTAPDQSRGRTLSPGARGAKQTTPHGPLQRLLDGMELMLNGP